MYIQQQWQYSLTLRTILPRTNRILYPLCTKFTVQDVAMQTRWSLRGAGALVVGLHLWVDLWWVCPLQNRLTSGGCSHRGFFSCGELPPVTPFLVPPTRHAIETGLDFSDFPVCNYFLSFFLANVSQRCQALLKCLQTSFIRSKSVLLRLRLNFVRGISSWAAKAGSYHQVNLSSGNWTAWSGEVITHWLKQLCNCTFSANALLIFAAHVFASEMCRLIWLSGS